MKVMKFIKMLSRKNVSYKLLLKLFSYYWDKTAVISDFQILSYTAVFLPYLICIT